MSLDGNHPKYIYYKVLLRSVSARDEFVFAPEIKHLASSCSLSYNTEYYRYLHISMLILRLSSLFASKSHQPNCVNSCGKGGVACGRSRGRLRREMSASVRPFWPARCSNSGKKRISSALMALRLTILSDFARLSVRMVGRTGDVGTSSSSK